MVKQILYQNSMKSASLYSGRQKPSKSRHLFVFAGKLLVLQTACSWLVAPPVHLATLCRAPITRILVIVLALSFSPSDLRADLVDDFSDQSADERDVGQDEKQSNIGSDPSKETQGKAVKKPVVSTGTPAAGYQLKATRAQKDQGENDLREVSPVRNTRAQKVGANQKTKVVTGTRSTRSQKRKPVGRDNSDEPVIFESEGLRGAKVDGLVELQKNVMISQGDFRMEANNAKLLFDKLSNGVQKIIAKGNVKIFKIDLKTGEKIRARGRRVVFNEDAQTVEITGNARFWRGDDLVRGKKIIYNLKTGWLNASKVEGVISPTSDN